jgi:BMFP domain-containing protein YqiC
MKSGRPLPFDRDSPNALGSVACRVCLRPFAIRHHSIQEILYDFLYDCEQTQEKNCMIYARKLASRLCVAVALMTGALLSPTAAQDIRGTEKCTAEAQMERRTGCLQANVEFLHQALIKLERDTREKINALTRDLAASRAEIAALKSTVAKLDSELAQAKAKADTGAKK